MVTTVVVINTLISLILLYVAWQVWKLKQRIGRIADKLTVYEHVTHAALYQAPKNIDASQQQIRHLRQSNQGLQVQIQQVRQIITLLFLGRRFWRRYLRRTGLTSGKKTVTK